MVKELLIKLGNGHHEININRRAKRRSSLLFYRTGDAIEKAGRSVSINAKSLPVSTPLSYSLMVYLKRFQIETYFPGIYILLHCFARIQKSSIRLLEGQSVELSTQGAE